MAWTPKPLLEGAPVPTFRGPYAAEFHSSYMTSQSDLQRAVLTDGAITESEMGALQDSFRTCLSSVGFTSITFEADGGMSLKPPSDIPQAEVDTYVSACGRGTIDEIAPLYRQLRLNPTHEDPDALMAACLVRVGLAPAGYTGADYAQDQPNGFPFSVDAPEFAQCVSDPQNAGR